LSENKFCIIGGTDQTGGTDKTKYGIKRFSSYKEATPSTETLVRGAEKNTALNVHPKTWHLQKAGLSLGRDFRL
jgi:hypothetical protein